MSMEGEDVMGFSEILEPQEKGGGARGLYVDENLNNTQRIYIYEQH